jgi:hypothetical protein
MKTEEGNESEMKDTGPRAGRRRRRSKRGWKSSRRRRRRPREFR